MGRRSFYFVREISGLILSLCLVGMPGRVAAQDAISLLREPIIIFNKHKHEKSISNASYRGEEGILMMNPDVARSFGLRVPHNPGYKHAMALYDEADIYFSKTKQALRAFQKGAKISKAQVKAVAESALNYNTILDRARKEMELSRSALDPKYDQRLDSRFCSLLMDRLLEKSLHVMSGNLREALGYFYNVCRGKDLRGATINAANVRFVNHVFNQFKRTAPDSILQKYDLDEQRTLLREGLRDGWRRVLGKEDARYFTILEEALTDVNERDNSPDLLLFLALMKQESRFDPKIVSSVGAVGLTQIMPVTGRSLGMKNIFLPEYFREAGSQLTSERKLSSMAVRLLRRIDSKNKMALARRAIGLMRSAMESRRKRKLLYARYAREVVAQGHDDRLVPGKAIRFGYRYFTSLMRRQGGDMSLALASYNAGPQRVNQYGGIPPFPETVSFRNRVLRYYREYERKIMEFMKEDG